MKADISAQTFREDRHFDAVVMGQGQVVVDADLNEQAEIDRRRARTQTAALVGAAGTPKTAPGFAVTVSPDGTDLLLSTGQTYVDGIVCVNEPSWADAEVTGPTTLRLAVLAPDDEPAIAPGCWVEVRATGAALSQVRVTAVADNVLTVSPAPASLPATGSTVSLRRVRSYRFQPHRRTPDPFDTTLPGALTAGAYRVELDVWHRHVSPVEDPAIHEVALGDVDTSTRLQTVWQARLVAAGSVGGGTCALPGEPAPGRLVASTVGPLPTDDPCELPDEAGYRGLENQLYRVEVHSASPTQVVLKWQRDNASIASRVTALGATLVLADMGHDVERGFMSAAFVEVTNDRQELEGVPGDLLAVSAPDLERRSLQLGSAPGITTLDGNVRARRWDGVVTLDLTAPDATAPRPLERGLQVALLPGALNVGDYWLLPARTVTGTGGGSLLWPTDDGGSSLPQPPAGIEHRFAALALVDTDGTSFATAPGGVRECRALFPALTALTADDVGVDPGTCGLTDARTVQDALDALCSRGSGLCTASATPGPGWESVFDAIPKGGSGQICFPVGSYPVTTPVVVDGLGDLVLRGTGRGSVISGATETLLRFTSCASVTLDSLSAQATGTGTGDGLAGTVSFEGCPSVKVTNALVTCGGAASRAVACLRVVGADAEITDSTFRVGDHQVGVLLVDGARSLVRGNDVVATGPAAVSTVSHLSPVQRATIGTQLFSDLSKAAAGTRRVPVTIGGTAMSFATVAELRPAWSGLVKPSYDSLAAFQADVDSALKASFAAEPSAAAIKLAGFVRGRVVARSRTAMDQGIVVAGSAVGDTVVEDNRVVDAIQGVHVAASHQVPRGSSADIAGSVCVRDNNIHVVVPPEGARSRHGIFVGNCDRLRLTGNDLSYEGLAEGDRIPTDGVRVFGFVGRFMLVRENVVDGFPGGITLTLLLPRGTGVITLARMWTVENNLVVGAALPITLGGPIQAQVKLRGNRPGPADR